MELRTMLLQEQMRNGTFRIDQVPTDKQLADYMSQVLGPLKIRRARIEFNHDAVFRGTYGRP